ncbi:MAG: hypothetical protein SGI90_12795 [Candidatus Eisenbacteria bacterium]|nr:hypothetical protein [Candidatus Eisenbacteria bacterium]
MGDLLYVSSILAQLRAETGSDTAIDLAAGRGLWADAVRHLPSVDRVVPVESWEEIEALSLCGYDQVLMARVSAWMPFGRYRGWSLRAWLERRHLVDVLARTMRVRLKAEHRRPVYHFQPDELEDDPARALGMGRFAVVAIHGFTHAEHNESAQARLLPPLLDQASATGHRLVLVGPPGPAIDLPPSVLDSRGESIRQVATMVDRAALVVSVLNGITVLADALRRPILLLPFGADPLSVVGPLQSRPTLVLGRPGKGGVADVDTVQLARTVARHLDPTGA